MVYPTVVLVFASLVLSGLPMFIVLVFVNIFKQLNGQLPTLTQIVVNASNLLRDHCYIVFPGSAAPCRPSCARRRRSVVHGRRTASSWGPDEDHTEPVMMMSVGVMVGVIVIAMYMPMFKTLQLVH
jgi:type II secretory pathway component PulF